MCEAWDLTLVSFQLGMVVCACNPRTEVEAGGLQLQGQLGNTEFRATLGYPFSNKTKIIF